MIYLRNQSAALNIEMILAGNHTNTGPTICFHLVEILNAFQVCREI